MRSRKTMGRAAGCVVAAVFPAFLMCSQSRGSLYWDADATAAGNDTTTGAGLGGTGVWGSSTNWFDGTSESPWVSGFDAVFTGAAGTVTLGASQTAASLTFKSDGFNLTGSTLTMDPSPATFSVDSNVTATVGSTLAGTATMTKVGAGTLILSNSSNINTASTAGGGWRIDGGVLEVAGDGSFGATIPDADYNAYTDIQLNQSTIRFAAPMSVSHTRRTKVNTNSSSNLGDGVFDLNQSTVTWYGSIQGGPGSLRVTDHNDNGGLLILGTDKLASINPFGSSLPGGTVNLTVENRCVVQTSGTVTPAGGELGSETGAGGAALAILLQTGGQIRSESGGYQFQRNLILGPGGGSLDTGAWEQTFLGTVSGTGSLSKFGTGKLILDNPSATWAGGTAIHSGTLELGRGGSNGLLPGTLANPSSVVIDSGAKLRFNRGSNKSFFDVISGAGDLEIANGNNATVRLVSDNTYTGLTTITSGELMIGQGHAGEPGSIASNVLDNAVLDFNRVENITYGGTISGSGALTKEAAGKLFLSANNTYSGGTSVLAGTLIAANATGSATGSGPVTVASGAAVGGTGTMSGAVTINAGAHLAPGTSLGTLTVGSLTLSSNSLLDYEFGSPTQASDLTVVTSVGGLVLNGGIVNVTPQAGFGPGEYPLLDYAGSFTGSAGNLAIGSAPSGFNYSFVDNPATTSIDMVVSVPEPGTVLGALLGVSFVTGARRRRRSAR